MTDSERPAVAIIKGFRGKEKCSCVLEWVWGLGTCRMSFTCARESDCKDLENTPHGGLERVGSNKGARRRDPQLTRSWTVAMPGLLTLGQSRGTANGVSPAGVVPSRRRLCSLSLPQWLKVPTGATRPTGRWVAVP